MNSGRVPASGLLEDQIERLLAVPFGPDSQWEHEAREVLSSALSQYKQLKAGYQMAIRQRNHAEDEAHRTALEGGDGT